MMRKGIQSRHKWCDSFWQLTAKGKETTSERMRHRQLTRTLNKPMTLGLHFAYALEQYSQMSVKLKPVRCHCTTGTHRKTHSCTACCFQDKCSNSHINTEEGISMYKESGSNTCPSDHPSQEESNQLSHVTGIHSSLISRSSTVH